MAEFSRAKKHWRTNSSTVVGELDDAFAKAKQLANAPDAKVVKYGPPFSLGRFLRLFGESESKIELQLPKQLVPQLESGRAYFLPSYYAP